jgi:septum formation topological specificity factor MinE
MKTRNKKQYLRELENNLFILISKYNKEKNEQVRNELQKEIKTTESKLLNFRIINGF